MKKIKKFTFSFAFSLPLPFYTFVEYHQPMVLEIWVLLDSPFRLAGQSEESRFHQTRPELIRPDSIWLEQALTYQSRLYHCWSGLKRHSQTRPDSSTVDRTCQGFIRLDQSTSDIVLKRTSTAVPYLLRLLVSNQSYGVEISSLQLSPRACAHSSTSCYLPCLNRWRERKFPSLYTQTLPWELEFCAGLLSDSRV